MDVDTEHMQNYSLTFMTSSPIVFIIVTCVFTACFSLMDEICLRLRVQ